MAWGVYAADMPGCTAHGNLAVELQGVLTGPIPDVTHGRHVARGGSEGADEPPFLANRLPTHGIIRAS